jgi:hypothetical protein
MGGDADEEIHFANADELAKEFIGEKAFLSHDCR